MNLYGFVENDVINAWDVLGLISPDLNPGATFDWSENWRETCCIDGQPIDCDRLDSLRRRLSTQYNTTVDQMSQISEAQTDLTYASGLHRAGTTIVQGFFAVKSAFQFKQNVANLRAARDAQGIHVATAARGSQVITNAQAATWSAKEVIRNQLVSDLAQGATEQAIVSIAAYAGGRLTSPLVDASDVALFLDAAGHGEGTLKELERMFDQLNEQASREEELFQEAQHLYRRCCD